MQNEDGYTIQELLVVLIVGSLLVGFSLSLFLFADKLLASWQKTTELRESVHMTLQIIALDIQKSRRILAISDTTCSMARHTGMVVNYRFNGQKIWRNEIPVNADTTIAMSVRIQGVSGIVKESIRKSVVQITVKGVRKMTEYSAEADILLPESSVQQFYASEEKTR
ncbi:MAG: hypothetical protein ABSB78_09930 [Bacteroidota bacterium]